MDTGESFEEVYDKLLISTGAKPVWPKLPGTDLDNLFTLRTVEDTLKIREFVEKKSAKVGSACRRRIYWPGACGKSPGAGTGRYHSPETKAAYEPS